MGSRAFRRMVMVAMVVAGAGSATALAQSGAFGVGDPALNQNGSARLPVSFPSAGTAVIQDVRTVPPIPLCGASRRIKTRTTQVPAAGLVELRVIPVGTAARRIAAGRTVKVMAQISFTPTGGAATTQTKTLKLREAGKAATTQNVATAACVPPPPSSN